MGKILSRISIAVILALVLFIVVTLALPVMPARAASDPECWAVIVGVSDYKYLNDLNYCDDNAREISRKLSPVWGEDHVRVLTDSQATRANILDAIDWMADNADDDDTVLFSFSGHGSDYLSGYFCPYDALLTSLSNDISSSQLASAFWAVNAEKTVIILDICHAGKFQSILSNSGRVILMASRSDEYSWEVSSLENSIFGYFLIRAFNRFDDADANGDYELSAEEIARYAGPLTTEFESTQHPVLDDQYSGELALLAKFVFGLNMSLPSGTTLLTLDGGTYTSVPEPLLWVPGVLHTIAVPELVDTGNGTRYVFNQWSDGDTSATRVITKGAYTADYNEEHLLNVISAYGETQGSGWYIDGTLADFSVTDYIELPDTRHYFTGWTGDYEGDAPSASVLMNSPRTVTAKWRDEYLLTLNSDYGTPTGAGWYREGDIARFSLTDYVETPDIRHYFTGWSGDYTGESPSASLEMSEPKVVNASWRNEYLLTLNSEYDQPTGAGWYREGETASVSVAPVRGAIVRKIFTGWTGDLTGTSAEASVTMDSPKVITANWRTDFVQLYILIGGVAVLAGVVTAVLMMRRRRRAVL
jgi:uncharacterized repeat protein (TIGR02543 family)